MAALASALAIALAVSPAEASPLADGAVYCGPRCVYDVLRHFGKNVELSDLIVEICGPELRRQSSLAELSQALERHGIATKLVSLPLLDLPAWPQPVILHLDGNHFVVLENSGALTATVKDGPAPAAEMSMWTLKRRTSPTILLTSDRPIGDGPFSRVAFRYTVLATGVLLVSVAVLTALKQSRRRAPAAAEGPDGAQVQTSVASRERSPNPCSEISSR